MEGCFCSPMRSASSGVCAFSISFVSACMCECASWRARNGELFTVLLDFASLCVFCSFCSFCVFYSFCSWCLLLDLCVEECVR